MNDTPLPPLPPAAPLFAPVLAVPTPPGDGADEARVRTSASRATLAVARSHGLTRQAADARARARAALDDHDGLLADARAAREAFCDAVGALAARLRLDGVPPQRMLVLVKAAVRGADGAAQGADPAAAQELMSEAVRCGIRAYYAAA